MANNQSTPTIIDALVEGLMSIDLPEEYAGEQESLSNQMQPIPEEPLSTYVSPTPGSPSPVKDFASAIGLYGKNIDLSGIPGTQTIGKYGTRLFGGVGRTLDYLKKGLSAPTPGLMTSPEAYSGAVESWKESGVGTGFEDVGKILFPFDEEGKTSIVDALIWGKPIKTAITFGKKQLQAFNKNFQYYKHNPTEFNFKVLAPLGDKLAKQTVQFEPTPFSTLMKNLKPEHKKQIFGTEQIAKQTLDKAMKKEASTKQKLFTKPKYKIEEWQGQHVVLVPKDELPSLLKNKINKEMLWLLEDSTTKAAYHRFINRMFPESEKLSLEYIKNLPSSYKIGKGMPQYQGTSTEQLVYYLKNDEEFYSLFKKIVGEKFQAGNINIGIPTSKTVGLKRFTAEPSGAIPPVRWIGQHSGNRIIHIPHVIPGKRAGKQMTTLIHEGDHLIHTTGLHQEFLNSVRSRANYYNYEATRATNPQVKFMLGRLPRILDDMPATGPGSFSEAYSLKGFQNILDRSLTKSAAERQLVGALKGKKNYFGFDSREHYLNTWYETLARTKETRYSRYKDATNTANMNRDLKYMYGDKAEDLLTKYASGLVPPGLFHEYNKNQ